MSDQKPCVLIVDDDPAVIRVLAALLGQDGMNCLQAANASQALALLQAHPVDVMITDLQMPGPSGIDLMQQSFKRWPDVPVILLTAHGTVEVAVDAMKKGAADFLLKPFDREEILYTVRKQIVAAGHRDGAPAEVVAPGVRNPSLLMAEVEEIIGRAARTTTTVLLRGESGTGKEVAARRIHELGPRKQAPFVKILCAALPDNLIESELFGYEKGAFTGAASRKPGRVELAAGGTLFLDEIGDVTPALQVKLLRLLQDHEFERLGGTETLKSTARIIAATHQPLEEMIRQKTFREDLFYRLSVLPIWIPPLRARPEDIVALAKTFAQQFGAANGRDGLTIEKSALATLQAHHWPGNVRELQNLVERLVVLSDGQVLTARDVDRELVRARATENPAANEGPGATLDANRKEAERRAQETALERCGNNRSMAARVLGIGRRTLYNRLREFEIE
jgi:two-component system response regulator AtoC